MKRNEEKTSGKYRKEHDMELDGNREALELYQNFFSCNRELCHFSYL